MVCVGQRVGTGCGSGQSSQYTEVHGPANPSCNNASPNLNLIERLWRFVRQQSLDSTYYESFEQFTAAIDECLDSLPTVHKSEMDTLLTHKFQMFEDVPLLAA